MKEDEVADGEELFNFIQLVNTWLIAWMRVNKSGKTYYLQQKRRNDKIYIRVSLLCGNKNTFDRLCIYILYLALFAEEGFF